MAYGNNALQKSKIRERYKGKDPSLAEIIPAKKRPDFYDDVPRRVAVYVRVSTDDPRQTSSFEIQKNYYDDLVNRHDNWTLVKIYADEGISGTSLAHRDAFNSMIDDCEAGKIDLIITKSVSRFSRNITDCIGIVRSLAELKNPVGVFFETEHIFTLKEDSEMGLSFQATIAQEESHSKSRIMNTSLEMRFSHGIVLTPPLLGYDNDEEGSLVINQDESQTVRLIFFMYLFGYSSQQIADTLTELERTTKKGNKRWTSNGVIQILQNERYCGDVRTRKTYTPNYLNHKSKKNRGDRVQHLWKDNHEPIVTRDDYIAVQHLISNAKYGNRGILPELHVITDGVLKGFVPINPRWAGFDADDYMAASKSVVSDTDVPIESHLIEAKTGSFDLRGFEVARSQFFNVARRYTATFNPDHITFSIECIRKFDCCQYVELLIYPEKHLIALRKTTEKNRNAVQWSKQFNGKIYPRTVSGAAFLGTVFELSGWKKDYRYRVEGVIKERKGETIMFFDLTEPQIFIPNNMICEQTNDEKCGNIESNRLEYGSQQSILAFPPEWVNGFGEGYYSSVGTHDFCDIDEWRAKEEGVVFEQEDALQVTSAETLKDNIKSIIMNMRQEVITNEYVE